MKLLIDTAAFLWIAQGEELRIGAPARAALEDADNEVYLSAASVWEICIKYRLGKLRLPTPPEQLVPEQRRLRGIESVGVTEAAALRVSQLPDLHRDPFDRTLISQAIEHAMTLVTPDAIIRNYPIRTIW
jgi:PIN domain nuclease of toxin-antitoxin system